MAVADDRAMWRRRLEGLLGVPATDGNLVDVLRNGVEIFPAMLDAIEHAEHTVDILTFVYWTGDIAQRVARALADRASGGCRVRVLLDALGAKSMDEDLVSLMEEAGADVRFFRTPDEWSQIKDVEHRTHRKILVCDGSVAFTGGVGIAEEWEGDARDETEWRDNHFRVRGPAVDGLRAAFVDSWCETGPSLLDRDRDHFPEQPMAGDSTVQVIRGEGEAGWNSTMMLKRSLVELAEERIRIATAYFSPGDRMLELLRGAVDRGVDVEVIVPGPHADKRVAQVVGEHDYAPLLDAGVRIHAFQPTMFHVKCVTVDGVVADVGSSNFNSRSFVYDEEVDLVVLDRDVTATLDALLDGDLERSTPIDPEIWQERGLLQRVAEKGAEIVGEQF